MTISRSLGWYEQVQDSMIRIFNFQKPSNEGGSGHSNSWWDAKTDFHSAAFGRCDEIWTRFLFGLGRRHLPQIDPLGALFCGPGPGNNGCSIYELREMKNEREGCCCSSGNERSIWGKVSWSEMMVFCLIFLSFHRIWSGLVLNFKSNVEWALMIEVIICERITENIATRGKLWCYE